MYDLYDVAVVVFIYVVASALLPFMSYVYAKSYKSIKIEIIIIFYFILFVRIFL